MERPPAQVAAKGFDLKARLLKEMLILGGCVMANRHAPRFLRLDISEMSIRSFYCRPPTSSEFDISVAAIGTEMPQKPFSVWHVNQQSPAGSQASCVATNNIEVILFTEKTEAALPVEGGVKLLGEVHLAQVGDDKRPPVPFTLEPFSGSLDIGGCQIDASHVHARPGKVHTDTPCAARRVQNSLPLPEAQNLADEGSFFSSCIIRFEVVVLWIASEPFHDQHYTPAMSMGLFRCPRKIEKNENRDSYLFHATVLLGGWQRPVKVSRGAF